MQSLSARLLSRVFIYTVVLLLILAFLYFATIAIIIELPYETFGVLEDYVLYHNAFEGPLILITEKLTGDIEGDVATLKFISAQFEYPIELIASDDFFSLPKLITAQYDANHIAFDSDDFIYYAQYPFNENYILKMGPVVPEETLDSISKTAMIFSFFFLTLSLIIMFLFLMALFWPLWRDAMTLRKIAESLAEGTFENTAVLIRSWLFKPIGQMIYQQALRIEKLLKESKIISLAMAHELKTPIARMKYALLMLDDSSINERTRKELQDLFVDINGLETLISMSLNYFRLQQYELSLNLEELKSEIWFNAIIPHFLPISSDRYQLHFSIDHFDFVSDSKLLSIALNNLLENATKYAKTAVKVEIKREVDEFLIVVEDDGIGIPEKERSAIFVPFNRLPGQQRANGHGLGLAYVQLAVDYLSGEIIVSESDLGGAKFSVKLPLRL